MKYAVVIYVAMCCQALPTLGCIQSGGRVAREERAGFAGKSLHKISVLTMKDYSPDYERL